MKRALDFRSSQLGYPLLVLKLQRYVLIMRLEKNEKFTLNPGWRILFSEMNLPVGETLRRAGLSPRLFEKLPVTLDAASFFRFWKAMEKAGNDLEIPILMAKSLDVEVFSPPLYSAVCSHNLRQAAERIRRYKALMGPITLDIEDTPKQLKIIWRWPLHLEPPLGFLLADMLFWVYLARKCTRFNIAPREVTVPILPSSLTDYLDYLGAPLTRADEVSLTFSGTDAELDFLSSNDAIWSAFEPKLRDQLAELQSGTSVTDQVRIALMRAIPAGTATASHVAETLSITTRTLQRRLQTEGASFKSVLNATRADLARHYLTTSTLPLYEISFLLGYKEPSSFNRAFREWEGMTPEEFRNC